MVVGSLQMQVFQSFFLKRKLHLRYDQASCWAKYWYIIDKKLSFWLWRQTVKASFNDTSALFVGYIEQKSVWSVLMWQAWFCFSFNFVRSHAGRGCCSIVCLLFQVMQKKKTGWLQNEY